MRKLRVYHDSRGCKRILRRRRDSGRNETGSQIAEFSAGLIILVLLVFLPLMDLLIVPVRFMLAQDAIAAYARKLAMCDRFSDSKSMLASDESLEKSLANIGGVNVRARDVSLVILKPENVRDAVSSIEVAIPRTIPEKWLPDKAQGKNVYSLVMKVDLLLSPAILLPGGPLPIPGLNKPFALRVTASREWENLSRNPVTSNFFINE